MTSTRALIGALAAGSLALALAGTASAQNNIALTGTTSQVDFACLGLLVVVGNPDCSFDGLNITPIPPANRSGPIAAAASYQVGSSPWDRNGGPGDVGPVYGDPVGDPKYTVPLFNSTMTIDDKGTPCDADDTLAASIAYGAATRNYPGGPGTQGEETWGDGDLSFTLAETVVDSATVNLAGGCDYVIGDAGAPPLLMSDGGAQYGDDVEIFAPPGAGQDLWLPNDGTDYQGNTPGVSTVEQTPNAGEPLTVANGPTYSCAFFGGAGGCEADGSHHEVATAGARVTIENSIWVVSTDAAGNVTNGNAYPTNETLVGGFNQPAWDSPVWIFTGTCTNCGKSVSDDSASVLEGDSVDISVLANDVGLVDPVTVIIDTAPAAGTATPNNSPGPQANVTITYDAAGVAPGQQTFVYEVTDDDGFTDTATVTVTVEADRLPVAPDDTAPGIDTTGVAPESQTSVIDVAAIAGVDLGNVPSTVTITAQGALGNAAVAGTVITYTPAATSFVGTDTYTYQIEDAQGDTDTGDITVNFVDSQPVAGNGTDQTDVDVAVDVDVLPLIQAGNGEVSDHVLAVTGATDGTAVLAGTVVTYTPDAGFVGNGTFTYSLDDANGDQDTGTVTITVNAAAAGGGNVVKLPGGSSALSPLSLVLLLGLPLLRRRRQG